MSMASIAHADDTQEPTPLHPDTQPAHVPFEDATGATPEAAWCEDMTAQPNPPCTHDWRTEDVSRDPEMRVVRAWCVKCGAKKMLARDDAHEWRILNITPSEQTAAVNLGDIPWTKGPEPSGPRPLTATERSAFVGMQARQRELVQMFNDEERAIVAEIEARLGLDAGSIGTTHTVNPQTWTVAVLPKGRPPQPDAP